jgi:hypothetical protein
MPLFRDLPTTQAAAAAMAALISAEHLGAIYGALDEADLVLTRDTPTQEAFVLVTLATQIKRTFYGNGGHV